MEKSEYKVKIVGAGLSGLIAAKVLEDHGYTPEIYEASDSVGGRIKKCRSAVVMASSHWKHWCRPHRLELVEPQLHGFEDGVAVEEFSVPDRVGLAVVILLKS